MRVEVTLPLVCMHTVGKPVRSSDR